MTTIVLSVPSFVPSTSDTFSLISPYLTHPATITGFGSLPTMPSSLGSIYCPNIQGAMQSSEAQALQLLTTQTAAIAPIASFLGASVDSLLPAVPGIGVAFSALLACNPDTLLNIFQSYFGGIPSLYSALNIPDLSDRQTMRYYLRAYMAVVSTAIQSAIATVTSDLSIPGMPTIPSMPTLSSIQSQLIANVPGASSMSQAILYLVNNNLPSSTLFSGLSFPGISAVFTPPSIPFPSINSIEPEVQENIINLTGTIQTSLLQPIVDFCTGTLSSYMGFGFSTVTFTVDV